MITKEDKFKKCKYYENKNKKEKLKKNIGALYNPRVAIGFYKDSNSDKY